jgi:hypothetical protein
MKLHHPPRIGHNDVRTIGATRRRIKVSGVLKNIRRHTLLIRGKDARLSIMLNGVKCKFVEQRQYDHA